MENGRENTQKRLTDRIGWLTPAKSDMTAAVRISGKCQRATMSNVRRRPARLAPDAGGATPASGEIAERLGDVGLG